MVDWIKKTDESGLAKFENMQLMLSKALTRIKKENALRCILRRVGGR